MATLLDLWGGGGEGGPGIAMISTLKQCLIIIFFINIFGQYLGKKYGPL